LDTEYVGSWIHRIGNWFCAFSCEVPALIRRIFLSGYGVLVKMDDPNITMEQYIQLEEEKARMRSKVYNWETTTYGKIWCDEDVQELKSVKTEFPAIVFNDAISFDESDDEDYTVIYDKNSFSYKIIYVDNLKTDSENDNDKVNMPSFPSPKPTVSYFDDLDYIKDFEKEFPAIVYNDALTSKSDFLTEPIVSPQHIDESNLKNETSLSECDEEEQNVIYLNDLFPFNVNYPDDLRSDKDNDDDKIDIIHSLRDLSIEPLPDVIKIDAQGSNKLSKTSHDTTSKIFTAKKFIKEFNVNIVTWNYLNNGMPLIFIIKNLYVPFGIPFDLKFFYKDEIKLGQV
ncbi:hypothetical protein Tco_1298817, partial [Tanacetum coccineum]